VQALNLCASLIDSEMDNAKAEQLIAGLPLLICH